MQWKSVEITGLHEAVAGYFYHLQTAYFVASLPVCVLYCLTLDMLTYLKTFRYFQNK